MGEMWACAAETWENGSGIGETWAKRGLVAEAVLLHLRDDGGDAERAGPDLARPREPAASRQPQKKRQQIQRKCGVSERRSRSNLAAAARGYLSVSLSLSRSRSLSRSLPSLSPPPYPCPYVKGGRLRERDR